MRPEAPGAGRDRPAARTLRAVCSSAQRAASYAAKRSFPRPRTATAREVDEAVGCRRAVEQLERRRDLLAARPPPSASASDSSSAWAAAARSSTIRRLEIGLDVELEHERTAGGAQRRGDAARASCGARRRRTSRAATVAQGPRRRRTRRAPTRTPRRGARPPGSRRARGSAGRCPLRSHGRGAACRQKPWMVEIQAPSSSRASSWLAGLDEPRANTRSQLAGRAVGERDHEDRLDVDAGLDGPHEALDEHARLPGPRAGGDEDGALGLDRRLLVGVRSGRLHHGAHARVTRHIGASSHHEGQGKPPFGSCATSPSRIRPAIARA